MILDFEKIYICFIVWEKIKIKRLKFTVTFFKHHLDNVFLKKTAFRKFSISFLVPLVWQLHIWFKTLFYLYFSPGIWEIRESLKNNKWKRKWSIDEISLIKKIKFDVNEFLLTKIVSLICFWTFMLLIKLDWGWHVFLFNFISLADLADFELIN